jgi:hypothetical protein
VQTSHVAVSVDRRADDVICAPMTPLEFETPPEEGGGLLSTKHDVVRSP